MMSLWRSKINVTNQSPRKRVKISFQVGVLSDPPVCEMHPAVFFIAHRTIKIMPVSIT
jgi:hypothetical protein